MRSIELKIFPSSVPPALLVQLVPGWVPTLEASGPLLLGMSDDPASRPVQIAISATNSLLPMGLGSATIQRSQTTSHSPRVASLMSPTAPSAPSPSRPVELDAPAILWSSDLG